MSARKILSVLSILCIIAILAGCATPTPETVTVVETVIVEKEGETVIETVEVVKTVEVEKTVVVEVEAPDPVVITWHFVPLGGKEVDFAAIEAALSEMAQAKGVNVKIDLVPYDGFANFGQTAPLMLASGETCDLIYTASWTNSFVSNASSGYYLALDELMPEHAPALWEKFSQTVWNMGRVGGSLYAIPNQQIWATVWGPFIRKDLLEKYPLDWDTISMGQQGLKDLQPYMAEVMESEPGLYAFTSVDEVLPHPSLFGHDYVIGREEMVIYDAEDPLREIKFYAEMPEYLEIANIAKEWNDNSFMPPEALTGEEEQARWDAGEFAGNFHVFKPEYWGPNIPNLGGYQFEGKIIGDQILNTAHGTLTAVCASTEHPKEAIQVLELANMDEEFFNTLVNGVEGIHWQWADEDERLIELLVEKPPLWNWQMGDTFNGYYTDPVLAEIKAFEATKEINDNAIQSVLLGFVFDPTPVESVVAQVRAIYEEYGVPLRRGEVDDVEASVEQLKTQMEAAGIRELIEEVQRQVDEWAATLE